MGAHIHLGSGADLADVQALAHQLPGLPAWTAAAWQTYVAPDPIRHLLLLVARAPDETTVGCLAASGFAETAELDLVLVHPAHQRQGVGGQLVRSWLAWARARGVKEALLEVRASNIAASRLYANLGFAVQGRRRNYYHAPTEDAIFMRTTIMESGSGAEPEGGDAGA